MALGLSCMANWLGKQSALAVWLVMNWLPAQRQYAAVAVAALTASGKSWRRAGNSLPPDVLEVCYLCIGSHGTNKSVPAKD